MLKEQSDQVYTVKKEWVDEKLLVSIVDALKSKQLLQLYSLFLPWKMYAIMDEAEWISRGDHKKH